MLEGVSGGVIGYVSGSARRCYRVLVGGVRGCVSGCVRGWC